MSRMQIRVLSDAEIESLHARTLDVFERIGIRITHAETLGRLARRGARVHEASGIARFDRRLIEELLALAPAVARETGLNGRPLEVGGKNRYYLSLILDPFIIPYCGGPRPPVLEDVRRHTIIGESLDRVASMMRMQFPVNDVPEPDSYYKTMEVFLAHATKHIAAYPTSEKNCQDWMDVAAVIADAAGLDAQTTPLLSVAMAVTSPMVIHGMNIQIMKMAMERCYPIISTVCPMAGMTSPYSRAGTLLAANVEALAPVLITQTYKPGHPVLYGIGPSVADMRTGRDRYYGAEKMIFKTAATQLGQFYHLPVSGEAGGSLTWRPDVQNGAESMAYLLASVTGGQNVIGGLGSLHNANGMSAEQIIMQCGLIDMAEYLAGGLDLDEEKLGLRSLAEAQPGGNFLTDDLTVRLLRSGEFFESPYFDLTGGYRDNAPGMYEIAHQTAEQLVSNYRPTVPSKVVETVQRFFAHKYQDKSLAV
ncbi:MAG: trimethylamine methyltransferase family protein [Phycisphaerae bacterium]|nr:trimethylamine methyltransferase family protein [Phycisphaerae bacterium]